MTNLPATPPSGHVPVALVTGGSSGIGLAAALRLSERGFRIGIAGRRRVKLDDAIAKLQQVTGVSGQAHERFAAFQCDLSEPDAPDTLVRDAVRTFGRLDAIVLNAGEAALVPIDKTSPETMTSIFSVNTFAPAQMIRAAWPQLVAQRGGCIVGVSSIAAIDPFDGFFAYAASKAALNSLIRSAAREGAPHGIRAYAVAPGAVETPMLRAAFSEAVLPRSAALDPDEVGLLIADCIAGARPRDNGRAIYIARADAGVQIKVGD